MAHTFLLEIGLEEMPAHVVTPSIRQLESKVRKFLKENRIDFDTVTDFSTPRRLAISISGLSEKQPDISETVKGPAKKIAQDEDGNWTKAAIGFTRGQGVTTDDITFKELKGTEYVYVEKHVVGKVVSDVLKGLKDVITSMTFPTMMKWGSYHFEFVRPIKWLVAMLDDSVIPFEILNITAGNKSRGHRFLGSNIELKDATDYEAALKKEFVIANAKDRKDLIRTQIQEIAKEHNWKITIDEGLLEEVTNLVEWPTAFSGSFDDKYLTIPDEVLITSMKDHQRFFYVLDQKGTLLPNFVSVRNGNAEHIENVVAGNEKVLTARLSDAMFFYEEDQKNQIADYVDRLKEVSFHDKISSMYDKMMRVQQIAQIIGKSVGLTRSELSNLSRASEIYKFDLVTGMVGEFAELQGVMGEKYALLQGETAETATAIREHYMPISAEGALPETKVGSVLAISDKLDSILTFFAAGMIPSGSNDPYALRRQAYGIVRIVNNLNWHLPISAWAQEFVDAEENANVAPKLDQLAKLSDVSAFIKDRVKAVLQSKKVRHDIIDAVIAGQNDDVFDLFISAKVLTEHEDDANFKAVIESLDRIIRISVKGAKNLTVKPVDTALFENDSEKELYEAVSAIQTTDIAELFQKLADLQPVIDNYFEATMVMVDDETVKNNRMNQLKLIADLAAKIGDLDQIIVK